MPLREAIATYLREARAVRCEAGQVMVVSGSQHGLDLATRLLLDPGDRVWLEDPGYLGARGALMAAGARLVPVPVDGDGLDVARGLRAAPDARLAYVTPSHQYPLGVTMSLARRLALLEWAHARRAWIVEDDYDSEYRYTGRPLASLQGLDRHGRVIYVGTFSKVLFPALRLGYVVVPPALVDAFAAARGLVDRHPPSVTQAVLAEFIAEGSFARHVRRMRMRYAGTAGGAGRGGRDGTRRRAGGEPGRGRACTWSAGSPRARRSRGVRGGARGWYRGPAAVEFRLRPSGAAGLLLGYAAWQSSSFGPPSGRWPLPCAARVNEPSRTRAESESRFTLRRPCARIRGPTPSGPRAWRHLHPRPMKTSTASSSASSSRQRLGQRGSERYGAARASSHQDSCRRKQGAGPSVP